jgi:hypothetical protein
LTDPSLFFYSPFQLVKYLSNSGMMVQVWGRHKPPKGGVKASGSTKQILQSQAMKGKANAVSNEKHVDTDKVKLAMEVKILQKRQEKLEQKLVRIGESFELLSFQEPMVCFCISSLNKILYL